MNVAEAVTASVLMPDPRYEHMWDAIVTPPEVKTRLLRGALLGLTLRAALPFETTALHGLAVLHGPPGTGKTTLAKALAHQLAPYMTGGQARVVEISPHGLMSAEHGQSQQKVLSLLTEHIPALADDGVPTVVVLDEVESMAVARSEASLAANPADVHRATDAVLNALDANATAHPHLFMVATSNFTGALDAAFLSRADVAILVPPPDAAGALAILRSTLSGMAVAYPALTGLVDDPATKRAAERLAGLDGRRIRKTVTEAMLSRAETAIDPAALTGADLRRAADLVFASATAQKAEVTDAAA